MLADRHGIDIPHRSKSPHCTKAIIGGSNGCPHKVLVFIKISKIGSIEAEEADPRLGAGCRKRCRAVNPTYRGRIDTFDTPITGGKAPREGLALVLAKWIAYHERVRSIKVSHFFSGIG